MQEKNAIKINSLPVYSSKSCSFPEDFRSNKYCSGSKKSINSGCDDSEPQQLAYFPHFSARIFIVMLSQLHSRYAAGNIYGSSIFAITMSLEPNIGLAIRGLGYRLLGANSSWPEYFMKLDEKLFGSFYLSPNCHNIAS